MWWGLWLAAEPPKVPFMSKTRMRPMVIVTPAVTCKQARTPPTAEHAACGQRTVTEASTFPSKRDDGKKMNKPPRACRRRRRRRPLCARQSSLRFLQAICPAEGPRHVRGAVRVECVTGAGSVRSEHGMVGHATSPLGHRRQHEAGRQSGACCFCKGTRSLQGKRGSRRGGRM